MYLSPLVASAAVCSKALTLFSVVVPIGFGFKCVGSMLFGVVLGVISSLSVILLRKRELVLCFHCVLAVYVLCFSLAASCVGLRSVIVAFSGHILTCFVNWKV